MNEIRDPLVGADQQFASTTSIFASNVWYIRFLWIAAAILPAVYLFIVVQYSAFTYPFADHLELVRFLQKLYDGTLTWGDLVSPHNQARPLVYRAIYLANALATNWDIRSEYAIAYICVYALFGVHIFLARKLCGDRATLLPAIALISILLFSPVGHNNFWWSLMLMLNMANLLIFLSIVAVSLAPNSWASHIAAAILGWLASYTLTNGIFLFVSVALTMQLTKGPTRRIDPFAAFWLLNLVVLISVYLPGIAAEAHGAPSVTDLVVFTMAYLGTPVAGLAWYPYRSLFDVPTTIWWPSLCGAGILFLMCRCLWRVRKSLPDRSAAVLVLLLCSLFGMLSALVTAWGRAAFDESGVASANSSRYSIFGVYVTFGLIYFLAATGFANRVRRKLNGSAQFAIVTIGLLMVAAS